jgi:hypothetical protein
MNSIESNEMMIWLYAQKWVRKTSRHACILKVLSGIGLSLFVTAQESRPSNEYKSVCPADSCWDTQVSNKKKRTYISCDIQRVMAVPKQLHRVYRHGDTEDD